MRTPYDKEEIMMTDEEIVARTLQDPANYRILIARYGPRLTRYIRTLTNVDDDENQDILQEVFIKAYYHLHGFDRSLKFSSWIYRIAHNQVISEHRKKSVRAHGHAIAIDEKVAQRLASEIDAKRETDIHYLRENIDKILARMDIKYREVLVLKFIEEKDYNEISDILKKPVGTVGTLVNRAKKQFKQVAAELGMEF